MPTDGTELDGRRTLRNERLHLAPGMHDLHRLLGRGAAERSGDGARVTLTDGRTALDFGSYAVTLLGHRHPAIVHAVRESLDLLPTSTRLLANPFTAEFAQRLVGHTGGDERTRVILGLNGSDVVEATLKCAIAATGKTGLLAVRGSFHGKTLGALAVTDDAERRRPFEALYRNVRFIEPTEDAVADALDEAPAAALIFEPIQGEGGGRTIPTPVLRRWSEDARQRGTFLIADEIQVGLRRCGPLSITKDSEIGADAVLFGKPLGGGVVPLSAAVCSAHLYDPISDDPFFHTSTFGGHPLSCAAGLAALDCLEKCSTEVSVLEPILSGGLAEVALAHPGVIRETRTTGLFAAIEATSTDSAQLLLVESARRGLLLAPCLSAPTVLRMLPPIVATTGDLGTAFEILTDSATAVSGRIGDTS